MGLGDINLVLGFDDKGIVTSLKALEDRLKSISKAAENASKSANTVGGAKGGAAGTDAKSGSLAVARTELKSYQDALAKGAISITQYNKKLDEWRTKYADLALVMDTLGVKIGKLNSLTARNQGAVKKGEFVNLGSMEQIQQAMDLTKVFLKDAPKNSEIARQYVANIAKWKGELDRLLGRGAQVQTPLTFGAIGKMDTSSIDALRKQREELTRYKNSLNELKTKGFTDKMAQVNMALDQNLAAQRRFNSMGRNPVVKSMQDIAQMSTTTIPALKAQRDELIRLRNSMVNNGTPAYMQGMTAVNRALQQNTIQTRAMTTMGVGFEKQVQRMGNTMSQFKNQMLSAFSIIALQRFGAKLFEVRGEFEMQQRSLAAILQNKAAADVLWSRNVTLALKSPFRLKEVTAATRELAAYRIEQDKLYDTNKMLMDISAGLGVEMSRLILAYGQVKSASVLRGQELRQFTEAGIPLVKALADEFTKLNGKTVTTAQIFDKISTRQVPFEMVNKIFKDMTESGGIFYNMQEIQSETLKGKISNLKDAIDVLYNTIGEGNDGAFKAFIDMLGFIVRGIGKYMAIVESLILVLGAYKIAMMMGTAALLNQARAAGYATVAEYQHAVATGAITSANIVAAASANTLAASFQRIKITLASNPWGVAILALSTLAAILIPLVSKTDALKKSTEDLIKTTDEYNTFNKRVRDFRDTYFELERAAKKTKEELGRLTIGTKEYAEKQEEANNISNKTRNIVSELTRAYPSLSGAIDSSSGSIDINIMRFVELTDVMREAMRVANALTLSTANATLEDEKNNATILQNRIKDAQESQSKYMKQPAWLRSSGGEKYHTYLITSLQLKLNEVIGKIAEAQAKVRAITGDTGQEKKVEGLAADINKWMEGLKSAFGKDFIDKKILTQNIDDLKDYKEGIVGQIKDLAGNIDRMKNLKIGDKVGVKEDITKGEKELRFLRAQLDILGGEDKETGGGDKKDKVTEKIKDRIKVIEDAKAAYDDFIKVMTKEQALAATKQKFDPIFKKAGISDIDLGQTLDPVGMIAAYTKAIEELKKRATADAAEVAAEFEKKKVELVVGVNVKSVATIEKDVEDIMRRATKTQELKDKGANDATIKSLFGIDPISITDAYAQLETMMQALISKGGEDRIQLANKIGIELQGILNMQFEGAYATAEKYKTLEDKIKAAQDKAGVETSAMKTAMTTMVAKGDYDPQQYLLMAEGIKAREKELAEEITNIRLTEFKKSPLWAAMFDDLNRLSKESIDKMYTELEAIVASMGKDMAPEALKELMAALQKLRAEIIERDPFKSFGISISKAVIAYKAWQKAKKDNLSPEELLKLENNYREAVNDTSSALKKMGDVFIEIDGVAQGIADILRETTSASNAAGQAAADAVSTISSAALSVGSAIIAVTTAINTMETASVVLLVIKAIIIAIQAVVAVLSLSDKKIKRQIDASIIRVQHLEFYYNRLGRAMEKAYDIEGKIKAVARLEENSMARIAEINKQIRLEDSRGKKRDEEVIQAAYERRLEIYEEAADARKKWMEELGAVDFNSAAQDFADAWIDAFGAGESGMDAMMEKYDEMILNMIKKQASLRIVSLAMKPLDDYITEALGDSYLTPEEVDKMAGIAGESFKKADAWMAAFMDSFGLQSGFSNNLSGLQKSIQGMSEETAEIMTAYLNSIRFKLFELAPQFEEMSDYMLINNGIASRALSELQGINVVLKEMRIWQNSITKAGHPSDGGSGLKTFVG